MSATASYVAQIFNPQFRRVFLDRASDAQHVLGFSNVPQIANLRCGIGLKICAAVLRSGAPVRASAFTVVELLVLLAVVTVLVATLMPAMARSRPNSLAFQCLNNNRQLCAAWRAYADDNRDRIVYSFSDVGADRPFNWSSSVLDFTVSTGNWDTNVDIVKGPLWPYTRRDVSIYRCPSDQSFVVINGVRRPRVRSMAMNTFLGAGGGAYNFPPYTQYRVFLKTTDLTTPGPAKTFVFLDMRQDSTIYPDFYLGMEGYPNNPAQYIVYDLPNVIHNRGCGFSFADGRAEIHHWLDARTTPPLSPLVYPSYNTPFNPDVAWLQDHATRPK